MCACTPEIRTLYCGKPGCVWPISGTRMPSPLDMLMEAAEASEGPGETWYAVYDPRAVRNQPTVIFRFRSDAETLGRRMFFRPDEMEIRPVIVELNPGSEPPSQPMPPITVHTP